MSGMDSIQHIVAVIHQEFARRVTGAHAVSAGRPAATPAPAARRRGGKTLGRIRAQIAAIDPHDPGRERKVFRAFLEAVLVSELGENLLLDPAFFLLVDRVEAHMLADPLLADHVREVTRALLEPG